MAKKANNETVTETATPNFFEGCPCIGYLVSDAKRMGRINTNLDNQIEAVQRRVRLNKKDMTPEQKEGTKNYLRTLMACRELISHNETFDINLFASEKENKEDDIDTLFE